MRIRHRNETSAAAGWTRDYRYAEPSWLEPDRVGNRLSAVESARDGAGFHYDEHGNTTAMPGLPALSWYPEDRLARVDANRVSHYSYDRSGRRTRARTGPDERISGRIRNQPDGGH